MHSLFFLGGEDQAPAATYSRSEAKLEIGKTAGEEKTRNPNKAKQSNQSTASQRKIESGDSVNNIALHPDSEPSNFGGESKRSGLTNQSAPSTTRASIAVSAREYLKMRAPQRKARILCSAKQARQNLKRTRVPW